MDDCRLDDLSTNRCARIKVSIWGDASSREDGAMLVGIEGREMLLFLIV